MAEDPSRCAPKAKVEMAPVVNSVPGIVLYMVRVRAMRIHGAKPVCRSELAAVWCTAEHWSVHEIRRRCRRHVRASSHHQTSQRRGIRQCGATHIVRRPPPHKTSKACSRKKLEVLCGGGPLPQDTLPQGQQVNRSKITSQSGTFNAVCGHGRSWNCCRLMYMLQTHRLLVNSGLRAERDICMVPTLWLR